MQKQKMSTTRLLMKIVVPFEFYTKLCGMEEKAFWDATPFPGALSAWEGAKQYKLPGKAKWYVVKAFFLRKVVPAIALILFFWCALLDMNTIFYPAPPAVQATKEQANLQQLKNEIRKLQEANNGKQ
jgi:hypothetical protein